MLPAQCFLRNFHCLSAAAQLQCVAQVDTNGTAPPLEAASSTLPWWKQLDMHLLILTYGLIALMYTLVDEVIFPCGPFSNCIVLLAAVCEICEAFVRNRAWPACNSASDPFPNGSKGHHSCWVLHSSIFGLADWFVRGAEW